MGPVGAPGRLNTMVALIYDSLEGMDTGMASASALILFAIIFVITMINLYVSNKTTHY
jgi:multiple sugar transport system permease protein